MVPGGILVGVLSSGTPGRPIHRSRGVTPSSMPPSPFLFLFLLFCIFLYFFVGLNGSFYLTLIFPLWDLLIFSSLGYFPHFRGSTLYITRSIEDLSHFTKVLNIK